MHRKIFIVTYDRIAIEQLDRKKVDYTAEGTAKRLHTLLKKAGVTGPIVLAVHSFGGIYAHNQIDTAQATDPLRNLPIVVLSGGNYNDLEPNFEAHWADRQAYIASLSSRSIHKTDTNSGHFLQRENPPFVIDGINELLNQLKTN